MASSEITVIPEDAREDSLSMTRPKSPGAPEKATDLEDGNFEDKEQQPPLEEAPNYQDFKLTNTGRLIFCALAVLTLMVSLDGTSISVALPVLSSARYSMLRIILMYNARKCPVGWAEAPLKPSGAGPRSCSAPLSSNLARQRSLTYSGAVR